MIIIPKEDKPKIIRQQRAQLCFPVINRGVLWYNSLTSEQFAELKQWYKDWLDAPQTLKVPQTPVWINQKINLEEDVL